MAESTASRKFKTVTHDADSFKSEGGPLLPGAPSLGSVYGTATGEEEHTTVAGGWAGTDDATSTAPSDEFGTPTKFVDGISEGMTTPEMDRWVQAEDEKYEEEHAEEEEKREILDIQEEESSRLRERRIQRAAKRASAAKPTAIPFSESFPLLVKQRHSIRAFKSDAIDPEVERKVLEIAIQAPSAGNLQAYEIYVIHDANARKEIASHAWGQDFIAQAPLILVFCAHPARSIPKYGDRGAALYSIQDATIAAAYAQLGVTALRLSSVWVGAFDEKKVGQAVRLPLGLRPVALLAIGYAAETPELTSRRSLTDIAHPDAAPKK